MQPLERAFKFEGFILDLRRGCLRGAGGEIELRQKFSRCSGIWSRTRAVWFPRTSSSRGWPNVVVTTAPRSGDRHQRRQRPVKTRHYRRSARVENPRSVVEASADLDDRKGTTADEKPDRLPRIR
jgi:hypothetical protein